MKTEKEKMLAGELYDASDPELAEERRQSRLLLNKFNARLEISKIDNSEILRSLLPNAGKDLEIQAPFYCDYGSNIYFGDQVFMNFNCVVLDVTPVHIGSRTMFGPNVQIYTATHPIDAKERATWLEAGKAIRIGDDVWIGGSVVICPGVSIGDRAIIGAGSVVAKDIPSDVFAAGNPCKIIKNINE